MGQENKKSARTKNTLTQGTITASTSRTNWTETDNQISQSKADYQARFRARLQHKLKPINYLLSDNEIRIIAAKITANLLEISSFFEMPTKEREIIETEIINELLKPKADSGKKTEEYETRSTDDETESNTENSSGYEDNSDDENAEQSNEVIPVIPKITPAQYLYAPGEKKNYEEVIPVIEKVIEVIPEAEILPDIIPDTLPKKDKGKSKADQKYKELELKLQKQELESLGHSEFANFFKNLLEKTKKPESEPEPTQTNNDFIPFIPPFIPFIPSINTEEPEQSEPEAEQAEASSSTQTNEQPKELSAESQRIIKLVNEVLISDPTEPSGKDIADYFNEPEAENKPKNSLTKFIKKIRTPSLVDKTELAPILFYSKTPKDNRLYYLSKEDKAKWAREYRGTDRIIAERLREKIGTYQISTAEKIATPLLFSLPLYGNLFSSFAPFTIDNLKIELEHSFSPAEVKEIVRQSNKESHEKLQGVENLLIRMEQDSSVKEQELAKQIINKNKEINRLKALGAEELKKTNERKEQVAEILGQNKKALESKEKVELTAITEKYRILEQNATQQEELLELKDKKITEFLQLINYQEEEKEILRGEWLVMSGSERELSLKHSLLTADLNSLQNNLDSEKRQRTNDINSKDRIIKDQDDALVSLTKDRTDLTNLLKTRDDELSQADREYQELEKDLKTPEIIHNFLYWADWGLKTNLRKNTQSFWTKTKLIFRFSLLILVSLVLLLIFTIIIRVLVAIYRNGKAIFTKKQDTASILKELIGGMKQAKASLTNKKLTETTAETKAKPEPKNIIEILPEFTGQEKKDNLRKLPPEERQIIKEAKKRTAENFPRSTKPKKPSKPKKLRTKRTKEPTK